MKRLFVASLVATLSFAPAGAFAQKMGGTLHITHRDNPAERVDP